MHITRRSYATTAGFTAFSVLLLAGSASSAATAAGRTYKVTAGTGTTGTVGLTGTSAQVQFADITTSIPATCSSATASGSAVLGAKRSAAGLLTIAKSAYQGCNADGQLDLGGVVSNDWPFTATAPTSATGVTTGTLRNIKAVIHDTDGQDCAFTMSGTVDASYNNNTGVLAVAPAATNPHYLTISRQSGNCLGLGNDGDRVSVTFDLALTSGQNAQKISITSN